MTDINKSRYQMLGEKPIPELLINFSVPAIVGMMINALYNVVDRIFLGAGVSQLAIGGVFLNFPILMFIMGFGMLIGIGGNSLASIRFGQGKKDVAERILGNAVLLVLFFGITLTIVFSLSLESLLRFFGASDTILPYAKDYGRIVIYGTTFQMLGFGINNFIRGEGNPRMAMITMFIGAITNIVLDYIFIFPMNMGAKGAALATIIGQFLSAVWVISYFLGSKSLLKLKLETLKPDFMLIREIVALGITPFSMQLVASGINIIFNNQLQRFGGDLATSSMSVIYSISTLAFMPVFGLNQGLQPIIGFNYGAGNMVRVQKALKIGIVVAVLYMSFNWIITMTLPHVLVKIFISRPDDYAKIKDMVIPGLRIFNIFIPIVGYQIIASNYFQAIGKPKIGFILTMSRQLLLLLPAIVILPMFFGLTGIWMSMAVSDGLSSLITTFFVLRSGILTQQQYDTSELGIESP